MVVSESGSGFFVGSRIGSRFLLEGWIQIGFLIRGRTQLRGFEVQIRIPTLIMYLAMSCKHLWNACSLQNKTGCSPFARLWCIPFCADTLYTHNFTHKKCICCLLLVKLSIYADYLIGLFLQNKSAIRFV